MMLTELTDAQADFVRHADGVCVEACPGAGKTHAIVGRLARLLTETGSRRGVAVLSFTNAARDELLLRCRESGLGDISKVPNYIGTVDSFINQFVFSPLVREELPESPRVVDSWDRMGVRITPRGINLRGAVIGLDKFCPKKHTIPEAKLNQQIRSLFEANQKTFELSARLRRNGLWKNGYFSASDARYIARELLDKPKGKALGAVLERRFLEVIIDEGQDSNPEDLKLFRWLQKNGVRVTFVCDPDQAIYAFRGVSVESIRTFQGEYSHAQQIRLTSNFRSSGAVCDLAATLRSGRGADKAAGSYRDVTHPIGIVTYASALDARVGEELRRQIDARGFQPEDAIVLSHGAKDGPLAFGRRHSRASVPTNNLGALAHAVSNFRATQQVSDARMSAVRAIEGMLLELVGKGKHKEPLTQLKEMENASRVLRRQASQVLSSLSHGPEVSPTAWRARALETFGTLALALPKGKSLKTFLRQPPKDSWFELLTEGGGSEIRCSTVHHAKGREYDAVCVVLPSGKNTDELIDSWVSDIEGDSESLRVLYVAVTRAKQFVQLALPAKHADRVMTFLEDADLQVDRVDIGKSTVRKSRKKAGTE